MGFPVFVYHDVVADRLSWEQVDPGHRPYVLERAALARQLDLLSVPRFRCRRLSDIGLPAWAGTKRSFSLTFDDGHVSNYREALPLLVERGLSACFFIVAGSIGKGSRMGWRELRELDRLGMEIGSHSLTHPFMDRLPAAEVRKEYEKSKEILEQGLGRPILSASLPRGWLSGKVREVVSDLGYRVFCTSEFGLVRDWTDPLCLPRFPVRAGMSAGLVASAVKGERWRLLGLAVEEQGKKAVKRVVGARRWQGLRKIFIAAGSLRKGAA